MAYTRERQVAVEAVTQAAELCRAVQAETVRIDSLEKGDRSPVTIADFGSQALVCRHLSAAFPRDPIVAEEDSAELRKPENAQELTQVTQYVQRFQANATPERVCRWIDTGKGTVTERFWTLDPIDGTKGFLRHDQYAIALALIEQGQVKMAVLGCPALPMNMDVPNSDRGVLFAATQGGGATMASLGTTCFVSIHVTRRAEENRWRFLESVEAAHGHPALQQAVAQAVGIIQTPLRMDSQAKYGALARGDAVLYLRFPSPQNPTYHEKIWDHAAGALIVEEAGGCVTDMHGHPLDWASDYKMRRNRGVIASNGILHASAVEALAKLHWRLNRNV
jgi:3'(2'), 5'-bisphosphate nucleotidase